MCATVGQGFDAGGMTREHSLSTGGQIDTKFDFSSFFFALD